MMASWHRQKSMKRQVMAEEESTTPSRDVLTMTEDEAVSGIMGIFSDTTEQAQDTDKQADIAEDETLEVSDDDLEDKEQSKEGDKDEPEEVESATFDEVAESLGLSPEEASDRIIVKVKVDGEESEVPLSELRTGYQREASYTRKSQALAEDKKRVETSLEAMSNANAYVQAAAMASPWAQVVESIDKQIQETNWDQLEADDPHEATLTHNRLTRNRQNAAKHAQQFDEQVKEIVGHMQQAHNKVLADEFNALRTGYGWSEEVAMQKRDQLKDYLIKEYGFSDAALGNIKFASMGKALYELMELKTQQSTKDSAQKKRVRKKLRVLKPGPSTSKKETKRARYKQLEKRAKQVQTDEAWAEALAERMGFN